MEIHCVVELFIDIETAVAARPFSVTQSIVELTSWPIALAECGCRSSVEVDR